MGKKSRRPEPSVIAVDPTSIPVVGGREPCPCGSGRRYKACHGKGAEQAASSRPFEGMASECDIVAMRELVPSATAPLSLIDGSGRSVTLCTVLPLAWPAIVRADGSVLLGLQVNTSAGDASREVGSALARALESEPGQPVPPVRDLAGAPRLQDLVESRRPLDITVHEGFEFWVEATEQTDDVRASLERANSYAHPTAKLGSVEAAYWTRMGEKEHLRWVMPHEEERLLNGLARLHAAGETAIGEGTRLVGMFRALGLVAPVWDLPLGTGSAAIEEPAAAFGRRLEAAMATSTPLTDAERRARSGLQTRQVTLR